MYDNDCNTHSSAEVQLEHSSARAHTATCITAVYSLLCCLIISSSSPCSCSVRNSKCLAWSPLGLSIDHPFRIQSVGITVPLSSRRRTWTAVAPPSPWFISNNNGTFHMRTSRVTMVARDHPHRYSTRWLAPHGTLTALHDVTPAGKNSLQKSNSSPPSSISIRPISPLAMVVGRTRYDCTSSIGQTLPTGTSASDDRTIPSACPHTYFRSASPVKP